MSSVTATGPHDAWALGMPNGGGPGCGADVEHWDGASWRRVPVPRGVALGLGFSLTPPVAASSPADAWIFPTVLASWNGPVYSYALRWTGRTWRKSRFPADLIVGSAAAFGPADVWAFGGVERPDNVLIPYAARYGGHAWRKVVLPVAPLGVSALSRRDMWAVGPSLATAAKPLARQVILAAHWTGRRWRTVPVPAIKVPKGTSSLDSGQVAAAGPHDIWWAYQVTAGEPSPTGLLRWHGGHWHAIKLPAAIAGIDAMTQDGHGGVWLIADVVLNYNFVQYWYHYSHGQWSRQLVPTPRRYNNTLFGMAWIPGTASVVAVGEADRNYGNGTVGVITRYGR